MCVKVFFIYRDVCYSFQDIKKNGKILFSKIYPAFWNFSDWHKKCEKSKKFYMLEIKNVLFYQTYLQK